MSEPSKEAITIIEIARNMKSMGNPPLFAHCDHKASQEAQDIIDAVVKKSIEDEIAHSADLDRKLNRMWDISISLNMELKAAKTQYIEAMNLNDKNTKKLKEDCAKLKSANKAMAETLIAKTE